MDGNRWDGQEKELRKEVGYMWWGSETAQGSVLRTAMMAISPAPSKSFLQYSVTFPFSDSGHHGPYL